MAVHQKLSLQRHGGSESAQLDVSIGFFGRGILADTED